ncbi:MAG: ABC transporter substrate-binding protein [Bifidobacterium adolescentis]
MALLNEARPPFDNVKARQAAAMAMDTAAMAQAVTFGNAAPANSTLPNALKFYDPTLKVNGFDLAAAQAAMAEAGYDGREITILITDEPEREQQAVLMQALWAQIGIKAEDREDRCRHLLDPPDRGRLRCDADLVVQRDHRPRPGRSLGGLRQLRQQGLLHRLQQPRG